MPADPPPTVLTIAGTDSGGGAGIAADLKTIAAHGAHGTFAVTVVTAQNTMTVRAVAPIGDRMVGEQIDAVLDDFSVEAVKTGLLYTAASIDAVADRAARLAHLVVDPVLVRGSGERMLDLDVQRAYESVLFPHAEVITPNVAEAALLTGRPINTRDDARNAARQLHDGGVPHVVVTGWLDEAVAVDVYVSESGTVELTETRVDTRNVHGSGCSFAAAIASRLAFGDAHLAAIRSAKVYVTKAIHGGASWQLGSGAGPIAHFA